MNSNWPVAAHCWPNGKNPLWIRLENHEIQKLIINSYACNSLTDFEYEAHALIGNGNYVNLLRLAWKKLWNHIKWTYFRWVLAILNHSAPVYQPATYYYIVQCSNLGLVVASCLVQLGWNAFWNEPSYFDFLISDSNKGFRPEKKWSLGRQLLPLIITNLGGKCFMLHN